MMNVGKWIEEKAVLNAQKLAILFRDKEITYAELDRNINKAANMAYDLGVRKKDKVTLLLFNCLEYVYLLYGLGKIGAVSACINPSFRGASLLHLLDSCDSKLAFVSQDLLPVFIKIKESLTKDKQIIWYPEKPEGANIGVSFRSLFDVSSDRRPPKVTVDKNDPLTFVHTSGTTGLAKWCILSHAWYLEQGRYLAKNLGYSPQDRIFNPMPFCHIHPHIFLCGAGFEANATGIMEERFSGSTVWDQVRKSKATIVTFHPGVQDIIMKQPVKDGEKDHSVRLMWAAHRGMMERFNIPVAFGGYGSSECGMCTLFRFTLPLPSPFQEMKRPLISVCGKENNDAVEIMIADDSGNRVPQGVTGEFLFRPKKPGMIFDGYYGMPEKTVQAWKNLWFHSGDAGYVDEDGNFHFVGRKAEGIKVKGEFIDVAGLETVIRSHPKIFDCAVVGVPAEVGEEDVKVWVQLREGQAMAPEEVLEHCKGEVPRFSIPRYIEFIKELPRAYAEKIQKEQLKKRGIGKCWDREKAGYKVS